MNFKHDAAARSTASFEAFVVLLCSISIGSEFLVPIPAETRRSVGVSGSGDFGLVGRFGWFGVAHGSLDSQIDFSGSVLYYNFLF